MTPGETIDRYVVEAALGEGGMARVYRVRHLQLGSLHALKVLHPHLLAHDEIRQRFIAEGRIQARLRHPHLVPVTDIISRPGLAGLVMDLLVGEDLEVVLERGAVPARTACQWTLQALSALAFVHDSGIVHRDIKPANLFIEQCPDGERRLRVMDFGIARDTEAARTAVTTQMGTVGYMSPEQILRPKTVDARSDLFSLGAVLYEMLTGSAPFSADSAFSAQQQITTGRFREPTGVTGREAAVIRRALRVDRQDRYPSAAAFAADLAEPEATGRSRWGIAAVGAALIGALAVMMVAAEPAPPPPPIDVPDYPMISIAPDTFSLGAPASERGRRADEAEVTVTLTRPYAIGLAEVSQALYRSVMHANPSFQVDDALPVERVTWVEAARFANALSAHHSLTACYRFSGAVTWPEGLDCTGYRLPTEAEWEVAARAGQDTPYASGSEASTTTTVGWTRLNAGGRSQPTGLLTPNDWGLLDMHGNVAEWCWDRYGKSRYDGTDPLGPGTGRYRVVLKSYPPYIHHFPSGNAGITRLLVANMVPGVGDGTDMHSIVQSRFDYTALDRPDSRVRVRLNSLAVRVEERDGRVEVTSIRSGQAESVRAKRCILAGYNMAIPHICPALPEPQKAALSSLVKLPLVYTHVALRNWKPWAEAGVGIVYSPGCYHENASIDMPVSLGGHSCTQSPDEPVVIHMVRVPPHPGRPLKDQFRAGRWELLSTPFQRFEDEVRQHLGGMLGPYGFDGGRDIAGITVNRWPHGYAYSFDSIEDEPFEKGQAPNEIGRQPFGRISIANSDAGGQAYANTAIDQAYRAANEVLS